MSSACEYKNPIIPGFAPDPSVAFVNGTFYLVNSSFHIFPGLPIYASQDLKDWTHIGNAINRPEQIDLSKSSIDSFGIAPGITLIAAEGHLAPSIRYHKGTFYVVCTNSVSDGTNLTTQNFYVTTKDIMSDVWSDPIFFEFKGIDPSLFFDDDDRAYAHGSYRPGPVCDPQCAIRQVELDIATGKALSETKEIWKGYLGKNDAEGPHIYKKDGWYYLLTAEGGTFEEHQVDMARSRDIWGPYNSCPSNPILTAYGTDEYVQHTGHGDLFQDGLGKWWITCLGVRKENGRFPLGRETFLAPVEWVTDGWPVIEHPRMSFQRHVLLASPDQQLPHESSPRVEDVYIRDANLADYTFSKDNKTVTLLARSTDLFAPTRSTTFVGKRQRGLDCTVATSLQWDSTSSTTGLSEAGLTVYKEDFRHISIYYDYALSKICFRRFHKFHGGATIMEFEVEPASISKIDFRIQASAMEYKFSFRVGTEWADAGSADTSEMTGIDFTGTIFGVFASSREGKEGGLVVMSCVDII
ncbi:hypothetical protein BP5796_08724 [Coleophoma crateriformis]|uniref:Beta-xylosidase C-terminal Concanavalin A-like domain-containing protein n=1 Tax=Coleophoma crateriformis TaxID=565419 RepID=A0A3D8R8F2_9HELO|nr:hypothetical protein BP5796_08724 [Coleophoma crateriformis]